MTVPAIRKVVSALAAQLAGIPGLTIITDRAPSAPVDHSDTPCCLVQFTGEQISEHDNVSDEHLATIDLEFVDRAGSTTIQDLLANWSALAMAKVQADRTLGGLVQRAFPVGQTADSVGREDVNSLTLALNVQYLTPAGNLFTVLGTSAVFL